MKCVLTGMGYNGFWIPDFTGERNLFWRSRGQFSFGSSIFGQQYQVYTRAPIAEVVREWYTGFLKGGCTTRNPTLYEIEQTIVSS